MSHYYELDKDALYVREVTVLYKRRRYRYLYYIDLPPRFGCRYITLYIASMLLSDKEIGFSRVFLSDTGRSKHFSQILTKSEGFSINAFWHLEDSFVRKTIFFKENNFHF